MTIKVYDPGAVENTLGVMSIFNDTHIQNFLVSTALIADFADLSYFLNEFV